MGVSKQGGGLGFRELESFNLALLAKQLWRILDNPDSLVASVMKEKYFKRTTILDAQARSNASLMWKSIMAARGVIKNGARWRVGDGEKINIWSDRWLPTPSYFKLQSPVKILAEDALVKNLFSEDESHGTVGLLKKYFGTAKLLPFYKCLLVPGEQ